MAKPLRYLGTLNARADAPADGLAWFRMTTEVVDGHDSVLMVSGCDLARFTQNPVVLLDHENEVESIAGYARQIRIVNEGGVGSIDLGIEFAETDNPDDAGSLAARLYRAGFLRAMSQSFDPRVVRMGSEITDAERARFPTLSRWGYIVDSWELLEASFVGVGSNPYALKRALDDGALTAKDLSRLTAAPRRRAPKRMTDPAAVTVDPATLLARIDSGVAAILERIGEIEDSLAATIDANHAATTAALAGMKNGAATAASVETVSTAKSLRRLGEIADQVKDALSGGGAFARGGAGGQ